MKTFFTLMVACSFGILSASANEMTDAYPDASPEANPAAVAIAEPAPAPVAAVAIRPEVPKAIADHINQRFPGQEVDKVTREGVTYVVYLHDGTHLRYDNCFNPICYGDHSHENHEEHAHR
ncbi:MAG: hypothetical protein HDS32_05290 [Bacteroides sp.]|nr:hypothetical protein [Bacteroides sp.]